MSSVRENAYLEANRVSVLTATIVSGWVCGVCWACCSCWPGYDFSLPLDKPSNLFIHSYPIQKKKKHSDFAVQQMVGCRAHTPLARSLPFLKNMRSYSSETCRLVT